MPKDNVSPTIEQAMALEEVSTRMLMEIYLREDILPPSTSEQFSSQSFIHVETVRGVRYYVLKFIAEETMDLTLAGGKTYRSFSFTRSTLEHSQDGKTEKLTINMSNNDVGFAVGLAQIGSAMNNMKVILREYFPDFPNEPPAHFFAGKMDNLKMTVSEFSFDISRVLGDYESDAPCMTYDPNCQYVFKDAKCRYSGSAETCDMTLTTCEGLGNSTRFGGHPSVAKAMVIK